MTVRAAQQATDTTAILDIAKLLGAINGASVSVLQTARATGDGRLQLQACGTVLRQLEFSHMLASNSEVEDLVRRVDQLEQALTNAQEERPSRWPHVA